MFLSLFLYKTYIHTHTYIYTDIYIHTRVCMCPSSGEYFFFFKDAICAYPTFWFFQQKQNHCIKAQCEVIRKYVALGIASSAVN